MVYSAYIFTINYTKLWQKTQVLYNKQFTLFCLKKANVRNKLIFTTTNLHYNVMFAYGEIWST